MLVSDVMTEHAECISPRATLCAAAERMKALNVGALPVCDNNRLVGIVTDRDITVRAVAEGIDPASTLVENVMTAGIEYCFDDESVRDAAAKMEDHQIRRLPVLNRQKQLVGILSLGDIAVRNNDDQLSGEALEQISRHEPVGV